MGGQVRPTPLDLHADGYGIRDRIQLLHLHPRQMDPRIRQAGFGDSLGQGLDQHDVPGGDDGTHGVGDGFVVHHPAQVIGADSIASAPRAPDFWAPSAGASDFRAPEFWAPDFWASGAGASDLGASTAGNSQLGAPDLGVSARRASDPDAADTGTRQGAGAVVLHAKVHVDPHPLEGGLFVRMHADAGRQHQIAQEDMAQATGGVGDAGDSIAAS